MYVLPDVCCCMLVGVVVVVVDVAVADDVDAGCCLLVLRLVFMLSFDVAVDVAVAVDGAADASDWRLLFGVGVVCLVL